MVPAQVVDDGAGRPDCERQAVAAVRLQRRDAEVAQQRLGRPLEIERVGLQRGDAGVGWRVQAAPVAPARAAPTGLQPRQLNVELGCRELAGGELARRDVHVGEAGPLLVHDDRGQVVVRTSLQQGVLDHRAGRDDADDLAVDEAFGLRRIARLLADGDLVAPLDEPGQVRLERVVRDAREGNALPAAHLPRGQRDLELPRDESRVIVERLVEVAHPEEQDGVLVLLLDAEVLPSGGGRQCVVREARAGWVWGPILRQRTDT